MRFGLPYQGDQLLNFIKSAVTPLFVGVYAGAAAVGYVNWARNAAFAPLMLSDSFGRVAFPAFSKLQDDKELLTRTVERSIRILTLVMCPTTAIMVALGPEITHVVFTDKWMPGLYAFYLFCSTPFLMGITLPMASAILSLGHSRLMLLMTLTLIAIEWGVGVPAIIAMGFTGIAIAQPISYMLFVGIYWYILHKQSIRVNIFGNVICQLLSALVSGLAVLYCKQLFNVSLINIFMMATIGYIVFASLIYLFKKSLLTETREYVSHISI